MDLLIANRILQIDDVEDFIEQYELKPYQRELVKKYIGYLKNKKVQKTLSKILKADSFDDENQIRKGLICHFLGLSSIEDETIILAKLFTSLLQKNKGLFSVYDRIKEIDGEFYLCKLIDEYFDTEIAKLEEDKFLLAIKKLKYNLILQNVGSHSTCNCLLRFCFNVALAREAGLAEMHLIINHTKNKMKPVRIDLICFFGGDVLRDLLDAPVTDEHILRGDALFVDCNAPLMTSPAMRSYIFLNLVIVSSFILIMLEPAM